ncbi:MAG: hypothetical protein WBL55_12120 [Xanthobacteraceae bacterium]
MAECLGRDGGLLPLQRLPDRRYRLKTGHWRIMAGVPIQPEVNTRAAFDPLMNRARLDDFTRQSLLKRYQMLIKMRSEKGRS